MRSANRIGKIEGFIVISGSREPSVESQTKAHMFIMNKWNRKWAINRLYVGNSHRMTRVQHRLRLHEVRDERWESSSSFQAEREHVRESQPFSKPAVVLSPRSQSFRVSRCLRSLPELSSGRSLAFGETGEVESVVKCSHLIKEREGKLLQLNLLCLLVFPHCALICSDLWWYREVNFRVRTKKKFMIIGKQKANLERLSSWAARKIGKVSSSSARRQHPCMRIEIKTVNKFLRTNKVIETKTVCVAWSSPSSLLRFNKTESGKEKKRKRKKNSENQKRKKKFFLLESKLKSFILIRQTPRLPWSCHNTTRYRRVDTTTQSHLSNFINWKFSANLILRSSIRIDCLAGLSGAGWRRAVRACDCKTFPSGKVLSTICE